MKPFKWSEVKSARLKLMRGKSFEELDQNCYLMTIDHPIKSGQHIMLFEIKKYIWAVPCILRENEIFLKTLYPSRKYTRMYKRGEL